MLPRSRGRIIAAACIVGLTACGAAYVWRHGAPPLQLATGTYLSPSRRLPDFSLIDHTGNGFGAARLRGHWSLLYFGYTNCPDVCPGTLSMLAALAGKLRADGASARPQVIFVSVDAKRDTPAQLSAYVPAFDPEFIGLTGVDQSTVEAVAAAFGVAVVITPNPDGTYAVDHSNAILVVDPDVRLTAILTGPFTVDALRADLLRIVAGHS